MKGTIAIIVGIFGGLAFLTGWFFDPGTKATLVTALVSGFASMLIQISSRDLVSRTQSLIDRGADESDSDGGELYSSGRRMKDRIEKLLLGALSSGVIAVFFAALRVLDDQKIWSAMALTFATIAVSISVGLFAANRALGTIIDNERVRRARKKARQRLATELNAPSDTSYLDHPNLGGYGRDGTGTSPQV